MLRVRMAQDERKMLDALAEAQGLTASDIVRQLVRREYLATFPKKPRAQRRTR